MLLRGLGCLTSASSIGSKHNFLMLSEKRLRCVQQTANYMMEDRLKGVSPAKSTSQGSGMWRCQPPQVKRTKSLVTRQHPQCQTERERWVGVASFVSARAGVSSCRGANTSGVRTESAREGTFEPCYDGTRAACASAEGAGADGTNAAAQCGVSWVDVFHGSMPVTRQTRRQGVKLRCRFRNHLTRALNRELQYDGCWSFQERHGFAYGREFTR